MKRIKCNSGSDYLRVFNDGEDVFIEIKEGAGLSAVYLSSDKIRKLRKQLKKALIQIESEQESET